MSDLSFQHVLGDWPEQVWRGHALAQAPGQVLASSYAVLDQVLPGGGWPIGAMTEILQGQAGLHEWRLVLPALAAMKPAVSALSAPAVVLVGAPHEPFAPSLGAQGLAPGCLVSVASSKPLQGLWAAEQALRCAPVGAVLAWLPQAQPDQLRRLHWAAHTYQKLLFVFRPAVCKHQSSPAPLRIEIMGPANPLARAHTPEHAPEHVSEHALVLRLLKRRGPTLAEPLVLPLVHPLLQRALQASQWRRQQRRWDEAQLASPVLPGAASPVDFNVASLSSLPV